MEIWWSRVIEGEGKSQLWVHGRNLWYPTNGESDPNFSISATIEPDQGGGSYGSPVSLVWDRLSGASGYAGLHDDPHRAIDRLNRFWLPAGQSAGSYRLTLTRGDGRSATSTLVIPSSRSRRTRIQTAGVTEGLSETTVVAQNGTLDLAGKTIVVPSDITTGADRAAIVLQSGSRLTNGRILIEEGNTADLLAAVVVRGNGVGIQLDAVDIVDLRKGGMCFWGGDVKVEGSLFSNLSLCGDLMLNCNLWCESRRNTFHRIRFESPRGWRAGSVGRMGLGEENLHLWETFEGVDRGWTGTPWGAAYYRTAFFECDSRGTGRSVGASEGAILWEAVEAAHGLGLMNGTAGFVQMYPETPENVKARMFRQGMFVSCGDRWARLTQDATFVGPIAFLTTDVPIDRYSGLIRVGNAICQNTVDRCRFEDGKSGIWLFGESMENDFSQCYFKDLSLAGVVQLIRPMEERRRYVSASESRNVRRFIEADNAIDFVVKR